MLSVKPWRADALVRLFASVLVCFFFLSAIALSVFQFLATQPHQSIAAFAAVTTAAVLLLLGALFILNRPWQPEKLVRNLAALLLCVYGGLFLTWLAAKTQGGAVFVLKDTTQQVVVAICSFQGAALVLTHFFLREHRISWREAFGLNRSLGRAILIGLVVGVNAVPIAWALQSLWALALKSFKLPLQEQEAVQILRATNGLGSRAVLGLAAIVIAPLAEEILFRGLMYPAIKQAGFRRAAVWITSLLFAAIHVNLATFFPLTILAIALIWVYEKTDNLAAPIVAHSFFNAANFVMLFLADPLSRTPGHR